MDRIKKFLKRQYDENKFEYLTAAAFVALAYYEYRTRQLAVVATESSIFLLENYIDKE